MRRPGCAYPIVRDRHPAARPSVEDGDGLHLDAGHPVPGRGARARVSLVVQGVLPADALAPLATGTAVALLMAAGDDPGRCRPSVERTWAGG